MKETIKTTVNSNVYKQLLIRKIWKELCLCPICYKRNDSIYGGENFVRKYDRTWKKYRKTQYRTVEK